MRHRRVGDSGLHVSELSLGTMLFGETGDRATPDDEAVRMVHAFVDAGGTHVDTANVYAGGRSEQIVGRALRGARRDRVTIATKVRFGAGDPATDPDVGLGRRAIARNVEASLRRLDTDVIDLYYAHGWDPGTPVEETLRALDDLVTAGKVRYVGVSNFRAWQVMRSLGLAEANGWARPVAGQYQYSLVVRDVEHEFRSLFEDQGVGLLPWGPLGGGFLTGRYRRDERPDEGRVATAGDDLEEAWQRRATERNWRIVDAVEQVARDRRATVPQVALAWLRSRSWVSSVLLGARTMAQFEDALGAADLDLADDEVALLDEVSAPPDAYPYRMMDAYGMS